MTQRDSRIIAAILAADVVDYSRLMGVDEAGTLAALATRRTIFDTFVREFDGRVFGSVGDSLMAQFASAVHAVQCAQAIQGAFANENAAVPAATQMRLRIAVNLGDVMENEDGVAGDAVNIAARLQALAKPGGILISGTVYDQVHLKVPARYADAGKRRVKNIAETVRTFEVLPAPESAGDRARVAFERFTSRRGVRTAALAAAFATVAAVALFWREIPLPLGGRSLGEVLAPAHVAANTIAVLPFINMTGDPSVDYLGDGIAEELQHRLSRVAGLRVAARRSAFAFKGKDVDVRSIADALDVSYVVEGSIRRQGNLVRVNAALVDRATGANRWSNSYASSGDYLSIENKIGTQVLVALERVLGVDAKDVPAPARDGDIAAYDLLPPGAFVSAQAEEHAHARCGGAAVPAIARGGSGFRPRPGWTLRDSSRALFCSSACPAHVAAAEAACALAQSLDATAYEVHEAVGSLRLVTGEAAEAEAAYRRALAIVPESPDALIGLAAALAEGGDAEQAERTLESAIAVQPRYAASHVAYGSFLFRQGRTRDAIAPCAARHRCSTPDNPAHSTIWARVPVHAAISTGCRCILAFACLEPTRAELLEYRHGVSITTAGISDAAEMFRKATELSAGGSPPVGKSCRCAPTSTPGRRGLAKPTTARLSSPKASSRSIRDMPSTRHRRRTIQARLEDGDRARQGIEDRPGRG